MKAFVSNTEPAVVPAFGWKRLVAAAALAFVATLPVASRVSRAAETPTVAPATNASDVSARRKLRRHWHHRRYGRYQVRRMQHQRRESGRVQGLVPELRALIADLQQRHGADSLRVISGRDGRAGRSCHPSGQAFDAVVSPSVMADLRSRPYGLITYSGGQHHVHVSSCAREAGLRAHKRTGRTVYARYRRR